MKTPPRYDDLPRPEGDPTGLPLSWGVWGADDQIGTLNRITDATVAAARDECAQAANRSAREHDAERRRLVDAGMRALGSKRFSRESPSGNCKPLI